MGDAIRSAYKAFNDPIFLNMYQRLEMPNLYSILGRSNQEDWYSHFIAWLLNPKSLHGLGGYPLRRFLALVRHKAARLSEYKYLDSIPSIDIIDTWDIKESCFMPDSRDPDLDHELTIINIRNGEEAKKGRLDISATIGLTKDDGSKEARVLLVCENKVESKEQQYKNKWQTQAYAEWAMGTFKPAKADKTANNNIPHYPLDGEKKFATTRHKATLFRVLVFLATSGENAQCDQFLNISYNELLNDVLIPSLINPMVNDNARQLISAFLVELDRNCYATSTEMSELISAWIQRNGDGIKVLTETILYKAMWKSAYNQLLHPRLNWLLCFCEKDKWDRSVQAKESTYHLIPREFREIGQAVYWEGSAKRATDDGLVDDRLNTKCTDVKLHWNGGEASIDDAWKEYGLEEKLTDAAATTICNLINDRQCVMEKIAKHIQNDEKLRGMPCVCPIELFSTVFTSFLRKKTTQDAIRC